MKHLLSVLALFICLLPAQQRAGARRTEAPTRAELRERLDAAQQRLEQLRTRLQQQRARLDDQPREANREARRGRPGNRSQGEGRDARRAAPQRAGAGDRRPRAADGEGRRPGRPLLRRLQQQRRGDGPAHTRGRGGKRGQQSNDGGRPGRRREEV
jgi:hypothetical protein